MENLYEDINVKITKINLFSGLGDYDISSSILNLGNMSLIIKFGSTSDRDKFYKELRIAALDRKGILYVEDGEYTYTLYSIEMRHKLSDGYYLKFKEIFKSKNGKLNDFTLEANCLTSKFTISRYYYASLIENTNFEINNDTKAHIFTEKIEEEEEMYYINIVITSSTKKYLESYVTYIIEIICLILGMMPSLYEQTYEINGNVFTLYSGTLPNYSGNGGYLRYGALSKISNETLDSISFKKYVKMRNETNILFDQYLSAVNTLRYSENISVTLIQVLDGIYKREINKNPHTGIKPILHYYMDMNPKDSSYDSDTIKIFKNDTAIVDSLYELRNYVCHAYTDHVIDAQKFTHSKYSYYIKKLILCCRIELMKLFGFNFWESSLMANIENIENEYTARDAAEKQKTKLQNT